MATLKAGTYTIKEKFTPPSKTLAGPSDYKYYPLTANDTYGATSNSMGYMYVYDDSITLGGNTMYDSFVNGKPNGTWNYQKATEWDDDGYVNNSVTYTTTDTAKLRTIIFESDQTVDDDFYAWFNANIEKPRISVDLTTLPGWSSLSGGSHNITVVAKADGYRDSEPSAAVSVEKAPAVVMPVKGDIITLDSKQYRVLKTEGTVAEVLAMYDASTSVKFDSASSDYNNTYAGKSLDTYCNSTFYSGLSAAMKNAIVDKTFTQDSWNWDSSVPTPSHYTGKYGSRTYYLTLANAAFGTSITRHCYVLSVQDVLDYLNATTSMGISDTTLTNTNIWNMFWNQSTSPGSIYLWLRSAYASDSEYAFRVTGYSGYLDYNFVYYAYAVRPAFQIDLSKIAWS